MIKLKNVKIGLINKGIEETKLENIREIFIESYDEK